MVVACALTAPAVATAFMPLASSMVAPAQKARADWSPYEDNGGTVAALRGEDYVVAGVDTRFSRGFSILSRNYVRFLHLTERVTLATAGMGTDTERLFKKLKIEIEYYKHQNGIDPSFDAIKRFLCIVLYQKRFFPYYTFNVLLGIDETGKPRLVDYDAIGSFTEQPTASAGSGTCFVSPILDLEFLQENVEESIRAPAVDSDRAVDIIKGALTSAGQRLIQTGDAGIVVVYKRDASGAVTRHEERFAIRGD